MMNGKINKNNVEASAFDSLYHLEIRNTLKHLTSYVIGKALSED